MISAIPNGAAHYGVVGPTYVVRQRCASGSSVILVDQPEATEYGAEAAYGQFAVPYATIFSRPEASATLRQSSKQRFGYQTATFLVRLITRAISSGYLFREISTNYSSC
jgi:hypothetical protein